MCVWVGVWGCVCVGGGGWVSGCVRGCVCVFVFVCLFVCLFVWFFSKLLGQIIFYSNRKKIQVFKIAKFEFKVTDCGLWAKCTQLWPLKLPRFLVSVFVLFCFLFLFYFFPTSIQVLSRIFRIKLFYWKASVLRMITDIKMHFLLV